MATRSKIKTSGILDVGLDDFAKKIIGKIDKIKVPEIGNTMQKGELLFSIIQGEHTIPFYSPVSGEVTFVNREVTDEPDQLNYSVYEKNHICCIKPDHLDEDLKDLFIGQAAVELFTEVNILNTTYQSDV